MINSGTDDYYRTYQGAYFSEYLASKEKQDAKINCIIFLFVLTVLLAVLGISKPIFANTQHIENVKLAQDYEKVYLQENFEKNIKNKYAGSYIAFPNKGVAHIKKIKYINSKPIKINIVELNTNVNPYLKIQPQIASTKLNSKTSVRKIAQKQGAIIAINGGFFKPQTGVPLGALMINGEVLTGPIYNRVGIAIFEDNNKTYFKMDNIAFDIKAYTKDTSIKIDNINQPRMLSTHTLLYTPIWGAKSPYAPKNGYNVLVSGNTIKKISANPIEIGQNEFVISAPKSVISKIAKNNKYLTIDIQIPDNIKGAKHIIGAGPYLVKNSQIYVDVKTQKLQAISGKNPRSAVGFKNDGTFIIVTIDGREKTSVGMTLFELAKLMKNIGCEYAMNFDGGSSSAMYIKGKIVNSAINYEGIAVSNALTVSEIYPNEYQISSINSDSLQL